MRRKLGNSVPTDDRREAGWACVQTAARWELRAQDGPGGVQGAGFPAPLALSPELHAPACMELGGGGGDLGVPHPTGGPVRLRGP